MLEESVVYQDVLQQGVRRGERKGQIRTLLDITAFRFGKISPTHKKQIETLSPKQLQELSHALFEVRDKTELIAWVEAGGYQKG